MLDNFYQGLEVPEQCFLGKRIFKRLFYDNANLKSADKKIFSDDIEEIKWCYTLKPETINILRYEDDEREYHEIAIIQVTLKNQKRWKRIAEIIQRSIPYAVLLVFVFEDAVALNVAPKRINRADSNRMTLEAMYDTDWISLSEPRSWQVDFFSDFKTTHFSYQNFFVFYQDMVSRVIALNCARHTESYSNNVIDDDSLSERAHALQEIDNLYQEQAEIHNKLKKEKNLGTQVQLNTQIKQIKDRIEQIKTEL